MEYQLGVENIEAEQAVLGSIFLESDLLVNRFYKHSNFQKLHTEPFLKR
ncbi:hypothetical protein ACTHQ0_08615 [Priestia megaterium]|nr:hypothetical protein [Priestia megaterium]